MSGHHLLGNCSLAAVADYITRNDVRKILLLIGAGVSVSAGIPDFRSPQTGIYANLDKYNLDSPTDAFSLSLLRESPSIFYDIARQLHLWPGAYQPTPVHHFIRLLAEEGRLLRCCTQNIDGLERAAGVPEDLLVEAHGSFSSASCIECHAPYGIDQNREEAMSGCISRCHTCGGIVKPDVVFFGEQLPERFFDVVHHDTEAAEMVFIIGTSLQVHPFAALPLYVRDCVPRVLINMERVGGRMFRFPDDDENETDDEESRDLDDSDAEGADVSCVPPSCTHDNTMTEEADTCVRACHSASRARDNDAEARHADTQMTSAETTGCASGDDAASLPVKDGAQQSSQRSEDEQSASTSSSDGYAQYGEYDDHPDVGRDVFFRGDCQAHIVNLAQLLGLGSRLAAAVDGASVIAKADVSELAADSSCCAQSHS